MEKMITQFFTQTGFFIYDLRDLRKFMQMIEVSGTELYKKAQALVENNEASFEDLEKAFHWFNVLLNTAYTEKDENIDAIYFGLGAVSMKREHKALAMVFYLKALEHNPEFLEAMNNIAYLYKKAEKSEEASYYFKKILDLVEKSTDTRPDFVIKKADYYCNYGSMFVGKGCPAKALEIFKKGTEYDPNHHLNLWNMGLAYLEMGNYEQGFGVVDYGERMDRVAKRTYGHDNLPWWDGTPGKNLVVMGEQGIGDEFMWGTLLKKLMKDCNVVLDVHPRNADLFRRSFPEIDVYGTRKDMSDQWGKRYQFDARIQMATIPKFYCKKEEDFDTRPYLVADPKLVDKYRQKLELMSDRPKIGFSWRGGTHLTDRTERLIKLELWLEVLKLDCDFISLQYDQGLENQVKEFEQKHNVKLNHWPETLENYDETAGLVSNLDLIISVPQSVVHLAGALGTLTWQLTPRHAMWQMGVYGKNMPWYSTVASFWQEEAGNWQPVMTRVKEELCSLLQMNTAA